MQQVYLSRRNLLTLLSKLDRKQAGEGTFCTITKTDTTHPMYPCSEEIVVTAVEDSDYYSDRIPGEVHPADDPENKGANGGS